MSLSSLYLFFTVMILSILVVGKLTEAQQLDSVQVHIEEDPDGDGFYQIQYSYKDRAGVWGQSNSGMMRVMYEVAPDTMVTDWYAVFFNSIADVVPDSAVVDILLFAQFARAMGEPITRFADGTQSFSSPDGQWYYVADLDTMEVEP